MAQEYVRKAPFEGLSEEEIAERIDAYENAKREAAEARKEFRVGITETPQIGKTYVRFDFPEDQRTRGFTFGDDERGGDILQVPNGAYVELDAKGFPVNPVLRDLVEKGELDLSGFPKERP